MLSTALPQRLFQLEKYGLNITIRQITDARGTVYNFWAVTFNGRTVKDGLFEREHSIPAILKHIADNTTMRTSGGDMTLRALTWEALDGCEHVPAAELRNGDRMVIGGVSAHTVDSIKEHSDGWLYVELGGRMLGRSVRRFPKTHLCNLIERGPQT